MKEADFEAEKKISFPTFMCYSIFPTRNAFVSEIISTHCVSPDTHILHSLPPRRMDLWLAKEEAQRALLINSLGVCRNISLMLLVGQLKSLGVSINYVQILL